MTQLHDLRLRLLVQQESERIASTQPSELDLSVVQARSLCWLALLAEAHEDQASDAERRGDTEQAMGWFADAMRLRDAIQVVTTIEIPLPATTDEAEDGIRDSSTSRGLGDVYKRQVRKCCKAVSSARGVSPKRISRSCSVVMGGKQDVSRVLFAG